MSGGETRYGIGIFDCGVVTGIGINATNIRDIFNRNLMLTTINFHKQAHTINNRSFIECSVRNSKNLNGMKMNLSLFALCLEQDRHKTHRPLFVQ